MATVINVNTRSEKERRHTMVIKVNSENELSKTSIKLRSMSTDSSLDSGGTVPHSLRSRSYSTTSSLDSGLSSSSSSWPSALVTRSKKDADVEKSEKPVEFESKLASLKKNLSDSKVKLLTEVFVNNLEETQTSLSICEFKKMFKFKSEFFLERIFNVFDRQQNGFVTLDNFIETVEKYSSFDEESKIEFLIDIYNGDGSGDITEDELKKVLNGCVLESGMNLKETDIENLSHALFQDSVKDGKHVIYKTDLVQQLKNHKELLTNMSILMDKWLIPKKAPEEKGLHRLFLEKLPLRYFSGDYWRNNKSFLSFMFFILISNVIIFTHRAQHFWQFPMLSGWSPNPFYMISRATGRTILFNTCLVLVLVLRYTITLLRKFGFANFLPLDHNIYFHKVVGCLIFSQGMTHAVMHLLNFGINIQPDPVKFIHLSWSYWSDYSCYPLFLYTLPEGCKLVSNQEEESKDCLPDSMVMPLTVNYEVSKNISECQVCPSGEPYSYSEWIFTTRPGMFGMGGSANTSGVALMAIIIIMFICSQPFVRRSGHFQVFYFTHMLYFAYFILLFFHAPDFWKWFLLPSIIWLIEVFYRSIGTLLGHGKTVVSSGTILPSKVTSLVIKRPARFNFNAGDMVFVKIPSVAHSEWHPFTISSAPEVKDEFTLHIRGVGSWTNNLYAFFEKEFKKQQDLNLNTKNVLKRKQFNSIRYHDKLRNSKIVKYIENTKKDLESSNCSKKVNLVDKPMDIYVDGPYGCPASNIYRAEHAILVGTGIGVTPFASILQSIMHRYWEIKQSCPSCNYKWTTNIEESMFNLRKVDFFWINRNVNSFEWFVDLLSQLETEQAEQGGEMNRFLDLHMYNTSALKKDDMKGLALQVAMDLLYAKEERDLVTGLKARTIPGRPNWDKVFNKIKLEKKGEVTVFYCGNPTLATSLKYKCEQFGFKFKKEVF